MWIGDYSERAPSGGQDIISRDIAAMGGTSGLPVLFPAYDLAYTM